MCVLLYAHTQTIRYTSKPSENNSIWYIVFSDLPFTAITLYIVMLLISIPHHKFQWLSSILFLWWGQWYTLAHTRPTHCVLEQPGLVFLVESWWSETPRKQEQVRLSKHRSAHPSQSGALNLPFVTVTSVPSRQPLPWRPLLLSALSVRTLTSQEIHVQRRQESGVGFHRMVNSNL